MEEIEIEKVSNRRPRPVFHTYQCGNCGFASKAKILFKLGKDNRPKRRTFPAQHLPNRRQEYESEICIGC